jgi:phenylalanyl-tRNA synthetase beta subunit
VSLRYVVRNDIKTLTKQEVDEISDSVNQILIQHGGTVR